MKSLFNEQYIWAAILKSFTAHSKHIRHSDEIQKNTRIIDIFPTITKKDEEANRFGMALLNTLFYLNKKFNAQVRVDYKPREEFDRFKTVQDVYDYFYAKYSNKLN